MSRSDSRAPLVPVQSAALAVKGSAALARRGLSDLDFLENEELDLSAGLVPVRPPGVHPDALPPDFADWDDAPPNEDLDLTAKQALKGRH